MEENDVKIRVDESFDFSDGLVIVAFPTAGFAGTIAANFIVGGLKLERVGAIYSKEFFPAAVVLDSAPSPPVRVHGKERGCGPDSKCKTLGVMVSEIPLPIVVIQDVAAAILKWAEENKVRIIVTFDSVVTEEGGRDKPEVFGISAKPDGKEVLEKYGIKQIPDGVIVPGLSGALLAMSELYDLEVITMVAQSHEGHPDARAAARLLEEVNEMLLKMKIDPEPLYKEAREIEGMINASLERAKIEKPGPEGPMYG